MNQDEFARMIAADPNLSGPVDRAAEAARPPMLSGGLVEGAVVVLMFPIVRYVVVHIGLPWLHTLKHYSELQREKVHRWIDAQYRVEGFDPDAASAASDALCDELERTTDASARASWENLAALMKSEK
jgi:hypothetical protein